MPEYTEEQIKEAQEQLSAARQKGFIAHLRACGKSASEIKTLHARYEQDNVKRADYLEGLRNAILGSESAA